MRKNCQTNQSCDVLQQASPDSVLGSSCSSVLAV